MRDIVGNTVQERIRNVLQSMGRVKRAIEIGAGHGETTRILCESCEKVLVIDPFEAGWDSMPESYSKPYPKHLFLEAMKPFNNWELLEKLSMAAVTDIKNYKADFAFIDGGQTFQDVWFDLLSCNAIPVVCVDDYDRPAVKDAVLEYRVRYTIKVFETEREIYLWK